MPVGHTSPECRAARDSGRQTAPRLEQALFRIRRRVPELRLRHPLGQRLEFQSLADQDLTFHVCKEPAAVAYRRQKLPLCRGTLGRFPDQRSAQPAVSAIVELRVHGGLSPRRCCRATRQPGADTISLRPTPVRSRPPTSAAIRVPSASPPSPADRDKTASHLPLPRLPHGPP